MNHLKGDYTDQVTINYHSIKDQNYLIYRNRAKKFFELQVIKKSIEKIINFENKEFKIKNE